MIINLRHLNVRAKIWTGSVDRYLEFDTDKYRWFVKDASTGEVRIHNTALDCVNIIVEGGCSRKAIVQALLKEGVPKSMLFRHELIR